MRTIVAMVGSFGRCAWERETARGRGGMGLGFSGECEAMLFTSREGRGMASAWPVAMVDGLHALCLHCSREERWNWAGLGTVASGLTCTVVDRPFPFFCLQFCIFVELINEYS